MHAFEHGVILGAKPVALELLEVALTSPGLLHFAHVAGVVHHLDILVRRRLRLDERVPPPKAPGPRRARWSSGSLPVGTGDPRRKNNPPAMRREGRRPRRSRGSSPDPDDVRKTYSVVNL